MTPKSICFLIIFAFYCLILLFSKAEAQIPTGASFWLKADLGVTESNEVVSEWMDESGTTTKSAFQTTPINQPTILRKSINNLPAIHFDGRYNYMDCAPVFPVSKDYTISIVSRVLDFSHGNSLVSGNNHSISFGYSPTPIVRNDTLPAPYAISNIPLVIGQPSIVTVSYNQSTQVASIYVNGEFADSAIIGPNKDPKVYIGAFQGIASFSGDIGEIVLYSRTLSKTDRQQLEAYLFNKYAILPNPAPDSIFTAIPKHLQFYTREDDDSATVRISGKYFDAGYDSICLKYFKNNIFVGRTAKALLYVGGKAAFSFNPRIHAELSEYSFLLTVKSATVEKQIAFRDSVVCGDLILINGQSNSIANNLGYTNQFFRTFGFNQSHNLGDTAWSLSSTAFSFGGGSEAGSWGVRLQDLMMKTYQLPICVINGGVGGTSISLHQPDPLNPTNLLTIYGGMLYRAIKANVATKAKVLFWYQGESDVVSNYYVNFKALYNAWKQDYPNLRKIYVMQVRPGCTLGYGADVRDLLRTLQDSFPNIESVSTMGLPGHDGCHFQPIGYSQLGDQLFRLLSRDFYGATDRDQISSPNIHQAYYANSAHTRIGLTFWPEETRFVLPADTMVGSFTERIKDYFFLNDTGSVVESMSTSRNRIFLDLKKPSSSKIINYLPDKYYNDTAAIYEGPWITNTRGIGAFSFYHVPIVDSAQASVLPKDPNSNISLEAYPNPSDGKFIIRYTLPETQNVTITISDLLGRTIVTIEKGYLNAGEHDEAFDTNTFKFPIGVYICKLRMGHTRKTIAISVHH